MQVAGRTLSTALAAFIAAAAALLLWFLIPHQALAADVWQGQVATDEINVRSAPSTSAPIVGTLGAGDAVSVAEWVIGERVVGKNELWGRLADGGYVYTGGLKKDEPAAPPAPPPAPTSGRWIDVNLTQQIATAYDGTKPVFWRVVSTGTPGWETPEGTFAIQRRVANETMDSGTLAVSVAEGYHLDNVLYTQYFTKYGHSIHDNYWKWDSPFGVPTSHGCIGMPEPDAKAFWDFATVGTPVVIHK